MRALEQVSKEAVEPPTLNILKSHLDTVLETWLLEQEQRCCPDVPSTLSHSVILLLFFHCVFPWWVQLPSLYTVAPAKSFSLLYLGLQKPQIPLHSSWTPLHSTGLTPAPPCPSYMENPKLGTALPSADQKGRIPEQHFLVHPRWSWTFQGTQTLLTIPPSMYLLFFSATTFYPINIQPMPLPSAR